MTPERWQQVKQALATALELGPEERAYFLQSSYLADPDMRADLEPLLDSGDRVRMEFLCEDDLADAARDFPLPEPNRPTWVGRRVGAYRVVESIGAGGMGEVYRAVRADDQYNKEVALKFVRAGQFDSLIYARFKNERQILAALDHPNIARLLDGGATDEGVPYLVMELIEGEPITAYCRSHGLNVRQRLELFLQVCAGVHYAHQHLIIHRDIKPQNILVTPDGIPKLLDFGIARILDPAANGSQADATVTGFHALTPRYASPEQIRGEAMTTATDVYSLGVVLYELLTGLNPCEAAKVGGPDLARFICEGDPTRPSATAMRAESAAVSDAGQPASPEKLRRQLSGDIDNIVLMALRKEAARRYASVRDFQEDIRRHLDDLPVLARHDTVWYRASKFVMRHKAGTAATTAAALLLIAGIVVTLHEERVAERRFNDVRALANSLIFDVHDSVKDLPGSTPARKIIVDRALTYLNVLAQESNGDLSLQRELAAAYERVGSVQGDYLENNLGDYAGTLVSYHKALDLRSRIAAASSDWRDKVALAAAYRMVAHQQWANGDPAGARKPIATAISISEAANRQYPDTLKILGELEFDHEVSGRIGYPGDPEARQRVAEDYRRALAVDEALLKMEPNDISTLHGYSVDLGGVAAALQSLDPGESLKNYRKALEIDQRLSQLSTDVRFRRSVAIDYGSIGSVYYDLGDYRRSAENNEKDLEIQKGLAALDQKNTLLRESVAIAYMNAADSWSRAGNLPLALEDSARALDIMRTLASAGPEHAFLQNVFAIMLVMRGSILTLAGQAAPAREQIEQGRTIYESLYAAGNMDRVNAAAADVKLGEALAAGGREREAGEAFRRGLAILTPIAAAHPSNLDAHYAMADACFGLGELSLRDARQRGQSNQKRRAGYEEAQSWFKQSLDAWHRIGHPNHSAPNGFQAGDPAVVARELKMVETALGSH